MKPINAGKDMRPLAQNDKVWGCISLKIRFRGWWGGGKGTPNFQPITLPLRLLQRYLHHPEARDVWNLPSLEPFEFFSTTSHLTCIKGCKKKMYVLMCCCIIIHENCLQSATKIFALIEVCGSNLASFESACAKTHCLRRMSLIQTSYAWWIWQWGKQ